MRRFPRAFLVLVTLCTLFLAACGGTSTASSTPTPSTITLNVFAAASLTESFNEIAMKYEKAHPNIKITLNFNGSQILEQQIANGAPADVFASADMTNMQKASDAGLVGTFLSYISNKGIRIYANFKKLLLEPRNSQVNSSPGLTSYVTSLTLN